MSRSNTANSTPNPSTRWFEWKGGEGHIQYYDKDQKKNIVVKDFAFLLLDVLSTATGYNEKVGAGIFANEVRDTRNEPLSVRTFGRDSKKTTVLAEGLWSEIKEKVKASGGKYAASVYLAYKAGDEYQIGNFRISGCALGPWIDFYNENRQECQQQAIVVKMGEEATKGRTKFYPPVFTLKPVSEEADEQAKKLDEDLQAFLRGYLAKAEPLDQSSQHKPEDEDQRQHRTHDDDNDEIPF